MKQFLAQDRFDTEEFMDYLCAAGEAESFGNKHEANQYLNQIEQDFDEINGVELRGEHARLKDWNENEIASLLAQGDSYIMTTSDGNKAMEDKLNEDAYILGRKWTGDDQVIGYSEVVDGPLGKTAEFKTTPAEAYPTTSRAAAMVIPDGNSAQVLSPRGNLVVETKDETIDF